MQKYSHVNCWCRPGRVRFVGDFDDLNALGCDLLANSGNDLAIQYNDTYVYLYFLMTIHSYANYFLLLYHF